jgi:hypothetical protein
MPYSLCVAGLRVERLWCGALRHVLAGSLPARVDSSLKGSRSWCNDAAAANAATVQLK